MHAKFNGSLLNLETEIKGYCYCCGKNITQFFGQCWKNLKTKIEPMNNALKTHGVPLLNKQGRIYAASGTAHHVWTKKRQFPKLFGCLEFQA